MWLKGNDHQKIKRTESMIKVKKMLREMNYLVVDFEMCMLKGNARKKMCREKKEIIQIGAVMLDKNHRIIDEFSSYVKPEYGRIDRFIEGLTGIRQEDVENAPRLVSVLMKFIGWIGDRNVMVLSWSNSDYYQLQKELQAKKIKNRKIQDLLDGWADFQYSFDKMLGFKNQFALEAAMKISRVQMIGREHDGLCDAYNTARLFVKVHRQSVFQLELVPICEYTDIIEHLSFKLGDLFTPELLSQFSLNEEKQEDFEPELSEKKWSIWRKLYSFFKGKDAVTDENWNKVLFTIEMKKVDLIDRFESFGRKKNLIENEI